MIVVHGIDYNHNGIYDDVLDRSELNSSLPGEATAPALCGPLVPTKTASTRCRARPRPRPTPSSAPHVSRLAARRGRSFALLCHLLGVDATALGATTTGREADRSPDHGGDDDRRLHPRVERAEVVDRSRLVSLIENVAPCLIIGREDLNLGPLT